MKKENETKYVVLGDDIGNAFVKTSSGIKFFSRVSEGFADYKQYGYNVSWNGKKFCVGDEDGNSFTNANKYESETYNVALLTSIALSFSELSEINVILVLGTPVEDYAIIKDSCAIAAKELGKEPQRINVNGRDVVITICDVVVAPQSAVITNNDESAFPMLVFDFGGGTFDVSGWDLDEDGNPYKTYSKTFDKFGFDKIVDEFETEVRVKKFQRFNDYKSIIDVMDNPTKFGKLDFSDIRDSILTKYVINIESALAKAKAPTMVASIKITGGPANLMAEYLPIMKTYDESLYSVISDRPQFANADMYLAIGNAIVESLNGTN